MTDRASVVPQLLGAAVGIVLGAALLFTVVGNLRDGDPTPEVVAGESTSDDGATAPDETASEAPADPGSEEPTDGASEEPTEAATDEPTEEPTTEPAPSLEEVDPASVSIQVLDAIGGEGGSDAAQAVADELREAGYDVVVVNRAGRSYDETTVFWSTDQEAGGRQVAAEIGAARAEATPAEVQLSDAVDVHVVVGADRA